jgi:hypothetical protein
LVELEHGKVGFEVVRLRCALRVDVRLRALERSPDSASAREVEEALRGLVQAGGDAADAALRLALVSSACLRRLGGSEGARAALALARASLLVGDHATACSALERAASCDPSVGEFSTLIEHAPRLAEDPEASSGFLDALEASRSDPDCPPSSAALLLGARIAQALGNKLRAQGFAAAIPGPASEHVGLRRLSQVDALVSGTAAGAEPRTERSPAHVSLQGSGRVPSS